MSCYLCQCSSCIMTVLLCNVMYCGAQLCLIVVLFCHVIYVGCKLCYVMSCCVRTVCVVLCRYGCSSCVMRGNCMSCHLCGSFYYVMSCLLVFKRYIDVHDMFCYICKCAGCVMEDHIMLCHLFMLMLKQNYVSSCYSM